MAEVTQKKSPFETRIHEIDLWRGILMCLVILDHLFNLLMSFNQGWAKVSTGDNIEPFYTVFRIAQFYWDNPVRMVVRWLCLGGFCFVSGLSCAFSRNNWKRAGQMIVLWFLILVFSNLLQGIVTANDWHLGVNYFRVDFNIIGVLAWSTLIYCFVQEKKWQWLLGIIIAGAVIHIVVAALSLTPSWPDWSKKIYALPFWRPEGQGDYLSLFPYISFFFGGALLSKFTYSVSKKSYFKRYNWERPFCFVGRHSLIIYVSHFLLLIGIFSLVGLFIK